MMDHGLMRANGMLAEMRRICDYMPPERGAHHQSYFGTDGKSLSIDVFKGLSEKYGIELVGQVDLPGSDLLTEPMRTLRGLAPQLELHLTFAKRLQSVFEAEAGLDVPAHRGIVMRPVTVRDDRHIRELLPREHFLSAADVAHVCRAVLTGEWPDLVDDASVVVCYFKGDDAECIILLSPMVDGHRTLYALDRDMNWSERGPFIIVPV